MIKNLLITQVRSLSGLTKGQIESVKTLGLKRIRHSVKQAGTADILGKIKTIQHLISVKEI